MPAIGEPVEAGTTRSRLVTWEDPAAARAAGAALSGLEVMRAIASGALAPPPVARLLGFDVVSIDEGHVVFTMPPAEEHLNPLGTVHGGIITTLLDTVMGCAVHTTLPAGVLYTTLELKVNFLRPALAGGATLLGEGRVVHQGSTVALAEGQIRAADTDKLIAHATSTCLVRRPPAR
jgi:uncharacterized protein (TIGR00369 family)